MPYYESREEEARRRADELVELAGSIGFLARRSAHLTNVRNELFKLADRQVTAERAHGKLMELVTKLMELVEEIDRVR